MSRPVETGMDVEVAPNGVASGPDFIRILQSLRLCMETLMFDLHMKVLWALGQGGRQVSRDPGVGVGFRSWELG